MSKKKLMFLIDAEGKTPEELSKEAMKAFTKFNKTFTEAAKKKEE